MTWYEIIFFILALIVMLVGIAGVILPVLPGLLLILGAAVVFAILTGFQYIGIKTLIVFAVLTAFSLAMDWVAAFLGVRRMGGSKAGMIGALVGMIAGMLIPGVGIFGFIIGAFVGAVVFELLIGKESRAALKAGLGSFIGFLFGGLLRLVVAIVMTGVFFYQVLF